MSYTKEYFDATDITSSSFVFASAGSGKTKILVDRYIKSLFFGIKPEEILCITFTNAAVFEMEMRISNILEKLYINENGFTHKYISETFKINPTIDNIKKAESLFFLFQENLSNLKILTIHSFCQKLLQQFPLESDISPNFEIIEERDSIKFLQDIKEQVLRDLNEETVQKLSDYFSIYSLESFVNKIQQYIPNFLELFEDFSDINEYKKYLDLKFNNSKNNIEFTKEQKYFINENFKDEDLENLYLTSAGDIRKKIPFPNNRTSQVLAEIIFKNSQNEKKKQVIEKTCIFLELVNQIIQKYEKFKSDNNVLDFSDVLFKTKYLLTKSCAKEFALSRICNKIKSIMIDEAQDLSK
ncbi:MAG: UvrD-helicase domain-containing protein, partial [Alphaproteobacteria bacterium]|nr:UvrD-helicase domain-containing protein [Alphaproteobacteria bacterium]